MAQDINFEDAWQELVAKAWADPALKARLLADPAGVLKDHGMVLPAGVTVKVVENTDKVVNLVLPTKPAPSELSAEELHMATAGAGRCRCRCRCGCGRCRCGGCEGCYCD
jgi:hypothetical protein